MYIFILLFSPLLWCLDGPPPVTLNHDGLERALSRPFEVVSGLASFNISVPASNDSIHIKLIDDEDTRTYQVNLSTPSQYRHYLHGDILQERGLLPDPKTFDKQTILAAIENAIRAQRYMIVRHLVPHAYRMDRSYAFRSALTGLLKQYADEGHAICALEYSRVRLRDLNRTKAPSLQRDGLLHVPTEFACTLHDHHQYLVLGLATLYLNALQCFPPDAIPPISRSQPLPRPSRIPQNDWLDDFKLYRTHLSRKCPQLELGTPFFNYYETFIKHSAPLAALEHLQALGRGALEGTKTLPSHAWILTENPDLPADYKGHFTQAHYVALLHMIECIKDETAYHDQDSLRVT